MPTHPGNGKSLTQSTNSNAKLIQKHAHRHIKKLVFTIYTSFSPVKLTHEVNYHGTDAIICLLPILLTSYARLTLFYIPLPAFCNNFMLCLNFQDMITFTSPKGYGAVVTLVHLSYHPTLSLSVMDKLR